jgi:hypothetical protein
MQVTHVVADRVSQYDRYKQENYEEDKNDG